MLMRRVPSAYMLMGCMLQKICPKIIKVPGIETYGTSWVENPAVGILQQASLDSTHSQTSKTTGDRICKSCTNLKTPGTFENGVLHYSRVLAIVRCKKRQKHKVLRWGLPGPESLSCQYGIASMLSGPSQLPHNAIFIW